jgi:hypothetical protein
MKIDRLAALFAAASLCAGCASVIEGTTQKISVITSPEVGAACTAKNAVGEWSFVTPGTATIQKSESVLTIRCSKPGYQDGTYYATGRMSSAGMVGMMVPYVGLLNAAVDASSGAAMQYPDAYVVIMKPVASAQAAQPAKP